MGEKGFARWKLNGDGSTDPPPRYLSPMEVASALGVARRTVYNWLRSGELRAMKIGRTWRVKFEEINASGRQG